MMTRILGIDYGEQRTGIAITDPLKITAQGLETIKSNGSDKVVLRRIEEIVNEYGVDTFVIGNPINLDGSESDRSKLTEAFIHKLKSRFGYKISKIPMAALDNKPMVFFSFNFNIKDNNSSFAFT